MIKFITSKQHKVTQEDDVILVKDTLTQEDVNWITSLDVIGLDLETNHLDPFIGEILLLILGNEEHQYVIDAQSEYCSMILHLLDKDKVILGANLKFDIKFIKVKYGIEFRNLWDVMIAEQRLLQGVTAYNEVRKKVTSISCSLENITSRRLGILPNGMDKKIRNEFIDANPSTFIFDNRHIQYAAADVKPLFAIRTLQTERISVRKQEFLIYSIEFPLISILANAELEGIIIDEEKWRNLIVKNKQQQFEYQCKLDEELRRLRDSIVLPQHRPYITNGKWDRPRNKTVTVNQENLFGDLFDEIPMNPTAKKKSSSKKSEAYINYSSTDVLIWIFGRLQQPLPTEQQIYTIPNFITKLLKGKSNKEIIDKSSYKFQTGEGVIEEYLIEYPNTPIRDFIKLLIEYRMYTTRLNTFGEKFLIKYKNKKTGRFHTIYRQCDAVTSRLQSGDKDNGWYNSQNIPAEKDYREAFIADEGYSIITSDLSGAEAVIMIDKARDEKFYQLAILNDDAHSPLGQAVWRAIGNDRLKKGDNRCNHNKTPLELSQIVISKKENKDIRTLFKNTTFASIYGCYPKKYGKMLNISVDEAKIGLNVMKSSLSKTFRMVETNSKLAIQNGYLILNERTNSRIWYNDVIEAKKNKSQLDFKVQHEIESSARNSPIQGTQADMVKEMMVVIEQTKNQNWDLKLLKQVHDELVYKCKDEYKEEAGKFIKNTMSEVGNKYLSFITISAEQQIAKSWLK